MVQRDQRQRPWMAGQGWNFGLDKFEDRFQIDANEGRDAVVPHGHHGALSVEVSHPR